MGRASRKKKARRRAVQRQLEAQQLLATVHADGVDVKLIATGERIAWIPKTMPFYTENRFLFIELMHAWKMFWPESFRKVRWKWA